CLHVCGSYVVLSFFFSSRRRHTRSTRDWSSDVCSSDLIQAIRLGARGFIDKAEPMERVVQEIEHALERQRLASQVAALRERLDSAAPLVGARPAMQRLKDAIARVAKIQSPVLVVGARGSGKDLGAGEAHGLGATSRSHFT